MVLKNNKHGFKYKEYDEYEDFFYGFLNGVEINEPK